MAYLECNGADLYVEDYGEGRPIVFVHGVMTSLRFFEPQLADLSNDYRTVAFDCRGHGRSEKTELGHTVAQYARDLHVLLERLDLDDVVLVGWSMGVLVSWDYVEQFGTERLAGLVDVDMEPSRFQWDDYDHGLTDVDGLVETLGLVQADRTSIVERLTDQLFAEPPTPETRAVVFDEVSRTPAPIKSAILFDALTRDYRAVLPEVDVPTLVCAGVDEKRGTVAAVKQVAELVPDARFERFEHSGHCPMLEEPDRFNAVLEGFVNSF